MQAPKVDAHKLLEEFKVKHKTKTKTKSLNFSRFYKYAALLIVALTAGYFIFNTNKYKIIIYFDFILWTSISGRYKL